MYAKPSSFKRSSENTTEADAQAAHEARRLAKLEAAGGRGFDWEDDCAELASLSYGMGSGSAASMLVGKPTFECLMDAIEADDAAFYDRYER